MYIKESIIVSAAPFMSLLVALFGIVVTLMGCTANEKQPPPRQIKQKPVIVSEPRGDKTEKSYEERLQATLDRQLRWEAEHRKKAMADAKKQLYAPYTPLQLKTLIKDLSTAESVIYRSQRYFLKGTLTLERMSFNFERGVRQIGWEKAITVSEVAIADHKAGKNMRRE